MWGMHALLQKPHLFAHNIPPKTNENILQGHTKSGLGEMMSTRSSKYGGDINKGLLRVAWPPCL